MFFKVEEELKCSKIDDMIMRCYVTVSKSHFSISDFVQAQPEHIKKSTANVISYTLAVLLGLKIFFYVPATCALVNFRLPYNMVEGGSHPGTRVLWLLMPAYQPWRMLWPGAWAMVHESSHAQLMLWG